MEAWGFVRDIETVKPDLDTKKASFSSPQGTKRKFIQVQGKINIKNSKRFISSIPQTPDPTGKTICYTDGASTGKHDKSKANLRKSGIGVYFPENTDWNISEPLGEIKTNAESGKTSTNQTAEMEAIFRALQVCKENSVEKLIIRTDSMYCINCLTSWWRKWVDNDWINSSGKPVIHKDQIIKCLKIMETVKTEFEKVKGHSGNAGNDEADRLAVEGAKKDLPRQK